jgi:hypothetical protein
VHVFAATVGESYDNMSWLIAIYAFSIMLAFFKAFRANPRLNVVSQTIAGASADLFHFLVVLMVIFSVFVLVAHMIFGEQIEYFQSPGRTVDTCFMMMLGKRRLRIRAL